MRMIIAAAVAATALLGASAGYASQIPAGTITVSEKFNPAVSLSADTFYADGLTLQLGGTGAFSNLDGTEGTMNGEISFSPTVGNTINENVADFFQFPDAPTSPVGTYKFSVSSVETSSLVTSGSYNSGALTLFGTAADAALGLTDTPASLVLTFNRNNGSSFSSSASFSVSPVGSAPEPGAWVLMIAGVGLAGAAFRRSRQVRAGQIA